MNKKFLFFIFLIVFAGSGKAQMDADLQYLDNYYQNAFEEWKIPGMAISIVQNDSIIFQKAYGYADIEKQIKVDENTLFAVASNTKAFTATALAILVEEGKLNWEDNIKKYLPYFEMYDHYVSTEMTVEDLLCHRSGLKTFSGDLLWFGTNKSTEEIVKAAMHLERAGPFRSHYGYSNIMYLAAGLIIEHISGKTWGEFIQERILNPLQMNRTVYSTTELAQLENVAQPYYPENGHNIKLEWLNWDNVVAAGGIISSVKDMSQWLMLNINRGTHKNISYVQSNSFEKLTTPHINFTVSEYSRERQPSVHFKSYGLGWSIKDHHGKKVISHGGGYDGMISKSWIIPEEKLGMIILTNNLNYLPSALMEKTIDVLIGEQQNGLDYSALYLKSFLRNQEKQKETNIKLTEEKGLVNNQHLPLEQYAGRYRDIMYGDVVVVLKNDQLVFQMEPTEIFRGKLTHWNDHVFTFRFPSHLSSLPTGKIWFDLSSDAIPDQLHIDVKSPDFHFEELEFHRVK